jgi:hypothetical protein
MPLFEIPGFYTGCYIVESLLQSTLECFYDPQCIDKLQTYISVSSSINVTVLDASLHCDNIIWNSWWTNHSFTTSDTTIGQTCTKKKGTATGS